MSITNQPPPVKFDPRIHKTLGVERADKIAAEITGQIMSAVIAAESEAGVGFTHTNDDQLRDIIHNTINERLIGEVNYQGGLTALWETRFANPYQVATINRIEGWRYREPTLDFVLEARPHITVIGSSPIRIDLQLWATITPNRDKFKNSSPIQLTTGSHQLDFPVWAVDGVEPTYESWFRDECQRLMLNLKRFILWGE